MTRLLLIVGFFTMLGFAGCARHSSVSSGTQPTKNEQARKPGPGAQMVSKPTPPPAPAPAKNPTRSASRAGSLPAIKERATSAFSHPAETEADEDALAVAAELIHRKLGELDPPVSYFPSPNEVKNEFIRRDSRTVRPLSAGERALLEGEKIDPNRVYVEYEVEVSADQVRDLRTRERLGEATRLLGLLTAVALAGFLFLRLDEHTGGYLTRWLAIGAVALAAGAAVGLYLL